MIFIHNKYTRIYNSIIHNAQARSQFNCYSEKHHIIPKSLGGNNAKSNLAVLTAREHFICHWLLTKMVSGQDIHKMKLALSKMCSSSKTHNNNRYMVSGRIYELVRKACSKASSGKNNPMYGKTHTVETRKRISEKVLAHNRKTGKRTHTEETKRAISTANKGKKHSDETKLQWSKIRKGRPGQDNNSGKHWFNDGNSSYLKKTCPEGCVPGRVK
jgi:hypothetical protein